MTDHDLGEGDLVFVGPDRALFESLQKLGHTDGLRLVHCLSAESLPRGFSGVVLYKLDGTEASLGRLRPEASRLPLLVPCLATDQLRALSNGAGHGAFGFIELPLSADRTLVTLRNAHQMVDTLLVNETLSSRVQSYRSQWMKLNQIGIALSTIHDLGQLLDFILRKCREITSADCGSLYLKELAPAADDPRNLVPILRFKVAQNDSKFIPFKEWTMPARKEAVSGYVALEGDEVLIDDVYKLPPDCPFQFNSSFDRTSGYRTRSMLVVPMRNQRGEIIGVIQLINKKRSTADRLKTPEDVEEFVVPFDRDDRELAKSLASQAGVAIENARLMEDLRVTMAGLESANAKLEDAHRRIESLFEGFVNTCAKAVEARDNALSGHTERMALYAQAVGHAINQVHEGPLARFKFNDMEMKALKYSAILHDFGKIGVREEILWKSSRLKPERLQAVRYRVQAFKDRLREQMSRYQIRYILENRGSGIATHFSDLEKEMHRNCEQLDRDLEFIFRIAKLGFLNDADLEELNRVRDRRIQFEAGEERLIDEEEYEHLSVRKGNLTAKEWVEMKKHVAFTYDILSEIPWEGELRLVPEWAGSHHEKRDGTGYHRGLKGDDVPIGGQILAMVDIYEALTASDRPYKKSFTREEAIKFLEECARTNWLNPSVVRIFVDQKLYEMTLPDKAAIPASASA